MYENERPCLIIRHGLFIKIQQIDFAVCWTLFYPSGGSNSLLCFFEAVVLPDIRVLRVIDFFHEHVIRASEEAHVVIEGLVDHECFAGFLGCGDTEDTIQIAGSIFWFRQVERFSFEVPDEITGVKSSHIIHDFYNPSF